MLRTRFTRASLIALAATLAAAPQAAFAQDDAAAAEDDTASGNEIIVTTTRGEALRAETPISISVVDSGEIDLVRPGHPSDILGRVPGVSVQQTNGEGSIVGIRQPIGTAPGAKPTTRIPRGASSMARLRVKVTIAPRVPA